MSLRRRIAVWLGRGRGTPEPNDAGWRVLRHLGLDDIFVVWAQRTNQPLSELWTACPRADWLVELCSRAGVPRRTIHEAVIDCIALLPEHRQQRVREAADRWIDERCEVTQVLNALALAIDHAFDTHPELDQARAARHAPVGRRYPDERIAADLAERHMLLRLSERVRRRISLEQLQGAIWGERGGDTPYR